MSDQLAAAQLRIAELEAERDKLGRYADSTLPPHTCRQPGATTDAIHCNRCHIDGHALMRAWSDIRSEKLEQQLAEARSLIDELANYADQAQIIVRESPRTDAIILHGMGKRVLAKVEAYKEKKI